DVLGVGPAQPLLDDRGEHLTQFDRADEVLVLVETRGVEVRELSVEPALGAGADREHRGGGAVVGAGAAVLLRAPPELGDCQQQVVAGVTGPRAVLDEAGDGVVDRREELGVGRQLPGVAVEAALRNEGDLDPEVGRQQLHGHGTWSASVAGGLALAGSLMALTARTAVTARRPALTYAA